MYVRGFDVGFVASGDTERVLWFAQAAALASLALGVVCGELRAQKDGALISADHRAPRSADGQPTPARHLRPGTRRGKTWRSPIHSATEVMSTEMVYRLRFLPPMGASPLR